MIARTLFVGFVVSSLGGAALSAQSREIDVRAAVDKTAAWVADRVTFTITIACGKGVDILADDLSKDKLRVEGFEILGGRSDRLSDRNDRTIYTFSYELTTYRVDVPELKVAPLTVRYYVRRPGQRLEDAAPAGEVQVPGAVVAFRSALPDGQESYDIRDARNARSRRLRYALLQPIGLGLVLLAVVPAAVGVIAAVRRTRSREKPRSARQVRHDERESLDALKALDVSTPAGRLDAYSRLNALVRDHVHHLTGVETAGLTPAEIGAALSRRNGRVPVEPVAGVLEACDQARYAPPDALPSADACRRAIEQGEQIVGQS